MSKRNKKQTHKMYESKEELKLAKEISILKQQQKDIYNKWILYDIKINALTTKLKALCLKNGINYDKAIEEHRNRSILQIQKKLDRCKCGCVKVNNKCPYGEKKGCNK